MQTARNAIAAIAFSCLAWAAIELALFVRQTRAAIPAIGDAVRSELSESRRMVKDELSLTRVMLDRRTELIQKMLGSEAGASRELVEAESRLWRGELTAIRSDSMRQVDVAVSKFNETNDSVMALLDEYRRIPLAVGQRLDSWTDCRGNGACWQSQATALLGASRVTVGETSRTMREIREATPRIVVNIDQTTANVARLTKPDALKWRVLKLAAPVASGVVFGAIK